MEIEEVKLQDLRPYERNPRKNEAAVPVVMESIRNFGFKVPLVIDKDNVIVCGTRDTKLQNGWVWIRCRASAQTT